MHVVFSLSYKVLIILVALGITGAVCIMLSGGPMIGELAVLRGSDRHFYSLAFSPNSKLLAAGQQDGTIKIWETGSTAEWLTIPGQDIPVHQFHAAVFSMAFNPEGTSLAWAGGAPVVSFLDLKSKKVSGPLEGPDGPVKMLRFSPCGQFLATLTQSKNTGVVRLWDLDAKSARIVFGPQKSKYNQEPILRLGSLAYAPDGKTLAVGIFGRTVLVDVVQGVEREEAVGAQNLVQQLAFTPNGKHIAGNGNGIIFWDSKTGKQAFILPVKIGGALISSLASSPDGKMLAVGLSGAVNFPSHVQIWDVEKKRELGQFFCHNNGISQVAWSSATTISPL